MSFTTRTDLLDDAEVGERLADHGYCIGRFIRRSRSWKRGSERKGFQRGWKPTFPDSDPHKAPHDDNHPYSPGTASFLLSGRSNVRIASLPVVSDNK